MTTTEDKEEVKKEKVEYRVIACDVHPDFDGEKIISPKYAKTVSLRIDCSLGVPKTDEEAKELYNCNLTELVRAGCKNKSYGENVTKNLISEAFAQGSSLESPEFLDKLSAEFRATLTTEKTRGTGTSVKAKASAQEAELKAIYTEYGLTYGKDSLADLQTVMLKKLGKAKKA